MMGQSVKFQSCHDGEQEELQGGTTTEGIDRCTVLINAVTCRMHSGEVPNALAALTQLALLMQYFSNHYCTFC